MALTRRELLIGSAGLIAAGCAKHVDPNVIRFANWGGAGDDGAFSRLMRVIYAEFTRRTGIRISIEGTPGSQEYVQKMLLSFVAGAEPDVMQLDGSSAATFLQNGVLAELSQYMANSRSTNPTTFFENVLPIATRGSKIYAVPLDFTPMVMYLNTKMLRDAGREIPGAGWTWETFLDLAKATTKVGQYGFKFANWMPGWIMWLWNNNRVPNHIPDVLSPDGARSAGYFDSDPNVETIRFLQSLITEHRVAPSLTQVSSMGVDPFLNGTAAMQISGHWSMVDFAAAPALKLQDIRVLPIPTAKLGTSQTVFYESGLAIGKNCRRKESAWKFIEYMTSAEVQMKIQSNGLAVCARKDVAHELASKSALEQQFLEVVPRARVPWGSQVEGYEFVETEGQKALDKILLNGIEVSQALSMAATNIDAYFDKKRSMNT